MIKAIAIDDEPPALDILQAYFAKAGDEVRLEKTFTSPIEAIKYLDKSPVDLIFMDINMPSLNGIDLYKQIPYQPLVVFATSYSEYAVESYDLNAVDYLLKPYTFTRFQQAIDKAATALRQQENGKEQFLILRVDYSLMRIAIQQILYVEGLDNYLKIHMLNQPPIVVRMTMKLLQDKLPENDFIRVHRSFIVSMSKVSAIRNKMLVIGDEEIPLGTSHERNFYEVFNKQKP
jgi:DNA-binding LytR/AlgR family response regulator